MNYRQFRPLANTTEAEPDPLQTADEAERDPQQTKAEAESDTTFSMPKGNTYSSVL